MRAAVHSHLPFKPSLWPGPKGIPHSASPAETSTGLLIKQNYSLAVGNKSLENGRGWEMWQQVAPHPSPRRHAQWTPTDGPPQQWCSPSYLSDVTTVPKPET